MRKIIPILSLVILCLSSYGQIDDPFVGMLKSTDEAEIAIVYTPNWGGIEDTVFAHIIDYSHTGDSLYSPSPRHRTAPVAEYNKSISAIALDWDADNHEDLIYAYYGYKIGFNTPGIIIAKGAIRHGGTQIDSSSVASINTVNMSNYNTSVAMAKGNFDNEPGDELLLAWKEIVGNNHTVKLQIFKINAQYILPKETMSIATKQYSSPWQSVDVSVGDYDGNGTLDIALGYVDSLGSSSIKPVVNFINISHNNGVFTFSSIARAQSPANSNHYTLALASGKINPSDSVRDRLVYVINYLTYENSDPIYKQQHIVYELSSGGTGNTGNYGSELSLGDQMPEIGVVIGELDAQGTPEVVIASAGNLRIYSANAHDDLIGRGSASYPFQSGGNNYATDFLGISDVNRDFRNEIMVAGNKELNDISGKYVVDLRGFNIKGSLDTLVAFGYPKIITPKYANSMSSPLRYAIAVADFNGGKLDIGRPRYFSRTDITPTVILNAPPTHFDKLNGHAYDVCKCRFWDTGTNDECQFLYTSYATTTQNSSTISTTFNSDWGVSSDVEVGGSFIGADVSAHVGANYGEKFSKVSSYNETKTITATYRTRWDDYIYGAINKIHYFEYPIDSNGIPAGYLLAAIREPVNIFTYTPTMGSLAEEFVPEHEPENLMSYRKYSNYAAQNPEVRNMIYAGTQVAFTQGQINPSQPGAILSYERSTVSSLQTDSTKEYGVQAGGSVEALGTKLEVEGTYSNSSLSTQTVESSSSVKVDLSLTVGLRDQLQEYSIRPYMFWSKRGALTIDYDVIIDNPNSNFWSVKYGSKPDFSMLLPWLNDTVKAPNTVVTDGEFYRKSKSIFYSKSEFVPGDTVTVYAYIYNKSLHNYNGSVQYQFYLGTPESGELLSDIFGNSLFTVDTIADRGRKLVSLKWRVPVGYSMATSKVYLSIDPNNLVDEIREDNNIGYKGFGGNPNPTAITEVSNATTEIMLVPNPADKYSQIDFEVKREGRISFCLQSLDGKVLKQLANENLTTGNYIVPFNTGELPNGVYLVTGEVNNQKVTKRLVVSH